MNRLNNRGFIPLVFILIAVLSTTAVSGVGHGAYKYRQTLKENEGLKEQIETQKDKQIQELQEKLETITAKDEEGQSATTTKEATSVVPKEVQNDNKAYEQRLAIQRASEEAERQKQAIAQQIADEATTALLLAETCKAQRDTKKTSLWNAMLLAVDLAEQQNEDATFESLLAMTPPGSLPSTSFSNIAKTSKAEHEKNLSIAETQMESSLAEFYENCLQSE